MSARTSRRAWPESPDVSRRDVSVRCDSTQLSRIGGHGPILFNIRIHTQITSRDSQIITRWGAYIEGRPMEIASQIVRRRMEKESTHQGTHPKDTSAKLVLNDPRRETDLELTLLKIEFLNADLEDLAPPTSLSFGTMGMYDSTIRHRRSRLSTRLPTRRRKPYNLTACKSTIL